MVCFFQFLYFMVSCFPVKPFRFPVIGRLEILQNLLPFGGVFLGRDHVAALQQFELVEADLHGATTMFFVCAMRRICH